MPGLRQFLVPCVLLICMRSVAAECPDLTPYYPGANPDWPAVQQRLAALMPDCLESAEYFALFGAAQLNSGDVPEALESLERALLLNPENGAAQIDYAQALYLQGDLFAARELNSRLLERGDLPANVRGLLEERQRSWQALTRQRLVQLEVLAGYDSNLNSAPDDGEVTLTLSGEDVVLALNPEFQQVSGPYLNARLGARFRQLAPDYQHNWLLEARGRASEDSQSDQLQLEGRYALIVPDRRRSWQLETGLVHLLFGGSSLYTATEAGLRYLPRTAMQCNPYLGLTLQHQLFHDNSRLNALEAKASSGLNCPFESGLGTQQLTLELALLENAALKSDRPGGDREGWQVSLNWRIPLGAGNLLTHVSHTRLEDRQGYNPLLADGADRWTNRTLWLLQYRRQISGNAAFVFNYFQQNQRSNIELFDNTDVNVEIGFSIAL